MQLTAQASKHLSKDISYQGISDENPRIYVSNENKTSPPPPPKPPSPPPSPQIFRCLLPMVCFLGCYTAVYLIDGPRTLTPFKPKPYHHFPSSPIRIANTNTSPQPESTTQAKDDTKYFIGDPVSGRKTFSTLPTAYYSGGGPVIVTSITDKTLDVINLQTALRSLSFIRGDDVHKPAPILVFNEGDLAKSQLKQIVRSTNRPIAFPKVNFTDFPPGFDPATEQMTFRKERHARWDHEKMNRFWLTRLWKHPALEHFETVMRIGPHTCFKSVNFHLPYFAHGHILYQSQFLSDAKTDDDDVRQDGLYPFALNYLIQKEIKPTNPLLWQHLANLFNTKHALPVFDSHFELMRKSFMQREDVANFLNALSEEEPYGVLRKGWDSSSIRLLLTAMFTNDDFVMKTWPLGFYRGDHCERIEVEHALAMQAAL